jgi:hypothetical protein
LSMRVWGQHQMKNKRCLLLSAGLLLLSTFSDPRGQEATNDGRLLRSFQGHSKPGPLHASCFVRMADSWRRQAMTTR